MGNVATAYRRFMLKLFRPDIGPYLIGGALLMLSGCAGPTRGQLEDLAITMSPVFEHYCTPRATRAEIRIFAPGATLVLSGPGAASYYPPRALDDGKIGSATLRCRVRDQKASRCSIEREDGDYLFGKLAQKAAADLEIPVVADGDNVQLDYQFIILESGFDTVSDEFPAARMRRCNREFPPPITDAGPVAAYTLDHHGKPVRQAP